MNTHAHLRMLTPQEAATRQRATSSTHAFRATPHIAPHRAAYEFYPTPPEATRALLSVERFDGTIWEPACGQGHISKVLAAAGHTVVSTDLAPCWNFGEGGHDFLAENAPRAKHIVTNPPYGRGLADAFVTHALALTKRTGGTVAMLLALQSLAHPLRHPFWTANPPAVIYALDDCQCWPDGDPTRATGNTGPAARRCAGALGNEHWDIASRPADREPHHRNGRVLSQRNTVGPVWPGFQTTQQ
jgi:hypothetical protein